MDIQRPAVTEHLVRILSVAGRWMRLLPDLLPATDAEASARWQAPNRGAVEDKIVAEATILFHVARRVPDPRVRVAVSALRDRLLDVARPARHLPLMRRAPQFAWPLGLAHTVLSAHGHTDDAYDAVFEACLSLQWSKVFDKPLFQVLEREWADAIQRPGAPAENGSLAVYERWGTLPAFLAGTSDLYAFTHALFFATDFGRHRVPASTVSALTPALDAYLADRLWADDLDLVGELALAALSVGAGCRYLTTALHVIWHALGPDGLLHGPVAPPTPPGAWSAREQFAHCYHPTLVAGLVAAAVLTLPYPGTSGRSRPDEVADAAVRLLTVAGTADDLRAAWVSAVDDAPDEPRRVIDAMTDGALSAACRRLAGPALEALLRDPGRGDAGQDGAGRDRAATPMRRDALRWLAVAAPESLDAIGLTAPDAVRLRA